MDTNKDFENILNEYIQSDKINHAYLIETNSEDRISLAYSLIKKIFDLDKKNITIDDLIRNNDLYVLKTKIKNIKKEEIISLKENFKTKSLYFGKRVYIIEEAEKLNSSSANTLLKFLEEPDENIYAILITKNKYHIIETILSRCQEIRYYDNIHSESKELEYPTQIIDFLLDIKSNKIKSIAFVNKYFPKEMFERNIFEKILDEILYVYYDILQYKSGLDVIYTKEYIDKIKELSEIDYKELNDMIISVNNAINKNKINGNTKLIMDNMIIEMFGGDLNA